MKAKMIYQIFKKKANFLYLVLLCVSQLAMASHAPITVQGKLDPAVLQFFRATEVWIKIHDQATKLYNEPELINATVDSAGNFTASYSPKNRLVYLSFWMINNGENEYNRGSLFPIYFPNREMGYTDESYLFESGDQVSLLVSAQGDMIFSGSGSEKLRCQHNIYSVLPEYPLGLMTTASDLTNSGKIDKLLEFRREILNLKTALRRQVLEAYRSKLDNEIFERISLDLIGRVEYTELYPMFFYGLGGSREESKKALRIFYRNLLAKPDTVHASTNAQANSAYYPEYLFERDWNSLKLFTEKLQQGNSIKDIYELLIKKYDGMLREQLLLICFRKLYKYFPEEALKYAEHSKAFLTGDNMLAIEKWQSKLQTAYPFELQDTAGMIHRLADFRGKTIVMDFWFTGCKPCMQLNAAMSTIIEKYRSRRDVVFITVCMDKDKAQWMRSIKSGKYTSAGTLDLYTNGFGMNHPLLKYYNFQSAPKQLLIGKKGDLISAAPPRPDNGTLYEYDDKNDKFRPDGQKTEKNSNALLLMKLIDQSSR